MRSHESGASYDGDDDDDEKEDGDPVLMLMLHCCIAGSPKPGEEPFPVQRPLADRQGALVLAL